MKKQYEKNMKRVQSYFYLILRTFSAVYFAISPNYTTFAA